MAAMFLAMVWHARRRAAAMDEVRRLADSERRLRERERDFVRDASHELRTPITVARGYAELIRVANGVSETGEDAGMILVELDKLNQISERMLTLARAGQADFLRPTRVDLEDLVSRTFKRWMIAAPRRWQLEVDADGEVLADGERLEAALDALIENAVAATGDGGRILIRGRWSDGDAVVDVVDDGTGIEPEHLGHLFDRFWRSERSRASRPGGTGLGLAIVKAIVEAHGGSVSVLSRPGEGTTFTIRVPGFEAAGETVPEPAATALFPVEGAAYPGLQDMAT
jgi:two-component system, OmpR family, sensor kinase